MASESDCPQCPAHRLFIKLSLATIRYTNTTNRKQPVSDWRKLALLNGDWDWDRDRAWTGNGIGLARQVRAISSQVAPISHIILSVCVESASCSEVGGEAGRQEKGAKAERAHLILKGFMRHFPFILTTKKDARLQWPGERGAGKGDRGNRQLDGRNVAHV